MTNEEFNKIYTANLNAITALSKEGLPKSDRMKALNAIAKYENVLSEMVTKTTALVTMMSAELGEKK